MVVRSDSDGQLHQFESVNVHSTSTHQQPQQQVSMQRQSSQQSHHSSAHRHAQSLPDDQQQYAQQYNQQQQAVQSGSNTPHSRQQSARSVRARADSSSAHSHRSGPSRNPSTRPRNRTDTAGSSTFFDGSLSSESEFIAYRDDPHLLHQPLPTPHYLSAGAASQQDPQQRQQQEHQEQMRREQAAQMMMGRQYGPYSYLNDPQNMAAERHYLTQSAGNYYNSSQESVNTKLHSTPSSRSSSSNGGHQPYPYYPDPHQQHQQTYSNARAPLMHLSSSGSSSGSSSKIPAGFDSINPYAARPNVRAVGGIKTATSTAPCSTPSHDSVVDVISQPNYTANHASETHFLYDPKNPEQDDFMHNPSQHDAIMEKRTCTMMSIRGFCNVATLVLIILALVGMFGAYPVILEIYTRRGGPLASAFGPGGESTPPRLPAYKSWDPDDLMSLLPCGRHKLVGTSA